MREMLKVYVPAILLIVAAFWVALRFVAPPPPKELRLATGAAGGFYAATGARYRDILARDGVNVILVETQGAAENLRRLAATDNTAVDMALIQGGVATETGDSSLVAVAGVFYEPVWVLVRNNNNLRVRRLADLKGRRIADGVEGSGARILTRQLLAANGVEPGNATLVDIGGAAATSALARGEIDAAFFVSAIPTQPIVDSVASGRSRLLSFDQAEAYRMKFPFLTPVRLPMGAADLPSNVPPADVDLIAPTAALVARADIHPALINLMLDAAREAHKGAQLFSAPGVFPTKEHVDFPLHQDAERYFERGPSLLYRYLPFWIAVWTERLVVLLIPLITIMIPVIRFAPPAYRWQVQRKIYRWYGRLQLLETEAGAAPDDERRNAIKAELDEMQVKLRAIKVPVSYANQLFILRQHLDFVRTKMHAA